MAYKTWVTYFLWLILGWFGAHHFYLKRSRHAFVWIWTLGGGFGVFWFLELFCLNDYVDLANVIDFGNPRANQRSSNVSWMRIVEEIMFSLLLGALTVAALPSELLSCHILSTIVLALAVAVGVHTVANMEYERCSLRCCFIGALLPTPILFISVLFEGSYQIQDIIFYSCLTSTAISNWKCCPWPNVPERRSNYCVILLQLSLANLAMMILFAGAIYYNGSITNQYGETVRIRDAAQNILNSPAWNEFKNVGIKLWFHFWSGGWEQFKYHLSVVLDPDGTENAYKVLKLNSGGTENEIKTQYKMLAKKYHPDKLSLKSESEKRKAQEKWIEIQQAYELLSRTKSQRSRKNEL